MARKYIPSEAHLRAVEQMASKGVSYTAMARALKISISTFKRNLNLFELYIKKGRDTVDEEAVQAEIESVEKSLLKLCLGYEYEEKHMEKRTPSIGEAQITVQKIIKKQVHPSVTAQMYYLGNRAADKWHSVNYQEKSNEIERDGLTPEESRKFMREMSSGTKED